MDRAVSRYMLVTSKLRKDCEIHKTLRIDQSGAHKKPERKGKKKNNLWDMNGEAIVTEKESHLRDLYAKGYDWPLVLR